MYSANDVAKALKTITERLQKMNLEQESQNKELPHTCNNCKYCHGKEGYDQQWGMTYCVHSWCDKDKNLMDSWRDKGVDSHYMTPCEHFEYGEGKYDQMTERERKICSEH